LYPELTFRASFGSNFGKIYGGQEAADGQFPFTAHLGLVREDGLVYTCTSTILDEFTIVTAAHCFDIVTSVIVTAGSVDIVNTGENAQIQTTDVFAGHEDFVFDGDTIAFDIGYVKLPEPLEFNEFVQPIEVADIDPPTGDLITAIGWGLNSNFGPGPNILHYVEDLTVVDDEEADIFTANFNYDHFVCTFQASGGICPGDSGGPIINAEGKLFGATSFASFYCELGPSCYTSVVFFKDWLRENADVNI